MNNYRLVHLLKQSRYNYRETLFNVRYGRRRKSHHIRKEDIL